MPRRNNRINEQQPSPAYVNDPNGYWANVARLNNKAGLSSLLPTGAKLQEDTAVKGRMLDKQISWRPTQARWKNADIIVSISDEQFVETLEIGGTSPEGRVSITVNKLQFNGAFPSVTDTIQLFANSQWLNFIVVDSTGRHDDNEPALLLSLERDNEDYAD